MALVLHRFPLSHYSEKARAALDFKGLDYRIEEHTPGRSQRAIRRLSGQRKVPVLEHDGTVVFDSTEIALYLERAFPDHRPLLPADPARRSEVLALEDRLDADLGAYAPLAALRLVSRDERFLDQLAAAGFPLGRTGLGVGAFLVRQAEGLIGPVGRRLDKAERVVRDTLLDLSRRLETSKYLVGDEPSLADVAAVSLLFHLKFPASSALFKPGLAGLCAHGLADAPALARFFAWRDQFYRDFLR